jgi:hypothetical protein
VVVELLEAEAVAVELRCGAVRRANAVRSDNRLVLVSNGLKLRGCTL